MSFIKFPLLAYLSLIFLSCVSGSTWQYSRVSTGFSEHNFSRLSYPKTAYLHDMELEFIHYQNQIDAFINVFSREIPIYEKNDKLALLTIKTQDGSYQILCDRYRGGQKIKIPNESISLVLHLLESNAELTFSFSSFYELKVLTKNFQKDFNQLKKKPLPLMSNKPLGIAF